MLYFNENSSQAITTIVFHNKQNFFHYFKSNERAWGCNLFKIATPKVSRLIVWLKFLTWTKQRQEIQIWRRTNRSEIDDNIFFLRISILSVRIGAVDLTVPLQRSKITPTSVLDMTLNYIWWWGSSFRSLRNVDYHFITSRSTLTWSDRTG